MAFRIVGAVGIKVRPDSTGFRTEAKAQLEGETKGLKAQVRLEPDKRGMLEQAKLAVAELNSQISSAGIRVKVPLEIDTRNLINAAGRAAEQVTRRLRSADTTVRAELNTDDFDRNLSRLTARARTAGRDIKTQLEDIKADITARIEANKGDIARLETQIREISAQDLDLGIDLSPEDMAANAAKIEAWKQEIEAKKVEIGVDVDRFREATRALGDMATRAQAIRNTDATPRINRNAFDSDLNHIIRRAQTEVESVKESLKRIRGEIDARINLASGELTRIQSEIRAIEAQIEVDPTMPQGRRDGLLAQIEALKAEAERTKIELNVDVDRLGRAEASLRELTRSRRAELTVTMAKRTKDDILKTLDAVTGAQTFKDTVRFFENVAVNADKVAFAAVAGISGIAAFAGTLTHLTGGLTTFAGQLGQIGGLAVTIPALFVGWQVLSSTFSLIFDTMGAALKGNAKALARFSDTAQGYILEFKEAYDDLRKSVQDEFYDNIGPTVLRTLDRTFPIIKAGFEDVARTGALLIRNAFFTLDELGRKGSIKKFFDNLNTGLIEAAPGFDHIIEAFATLTEFGSSKFPEVGRLLADMGTQFDLFVGRAEAQNKLATWFETAKTRAGQLYDGLKNFVGTFQAISDAAYRAGYDGIGLFQEVMERVRDTVTGPVFQNTMTTLFEGARLGAKKFFEVVQPLGAMLSELAPTISQGFIDVADGIGSLVGDIARSFTDSPFFKQGLGDLFKGFRDGLKALGDYLPTITNGLGSLGTILGDMFRGFTPIFGGVVAGVAGAISAMQPSLSGLAPDMASVAMSVVDMGTQLLQIGASPFSLLVDTFTALPQPMQQMVVFAKPLTSFFSASLPLIKDFAGKIATLMGAGPGSLAGIKLAAGVGFGLAVGGLLWFLQKSGEDARQAQAELRKLQEDALAIAQLKIENPFTPLEAQDEAIGQASQRADQILAEWDAVQKGIQNSYGSLEEFKGAFPGLANPELLFSGKPDRQGLIDTYLGTDNARSRQTLGNLADMRNGLAELEGASPQRWIQSTFGNDQADIMHNFGLQIDSLRDTSAEAQKKYGELMNSVEGRTSTVLNGAKAITEEFGRVTLNTVPDVITRVDSATSTFDKFSSMGQIMATTLGGTSKEIDANADKFAGALRKYGDSPKDMAKFLTGMDLNKTEIEKVFSGLGYSAEEFEAAFKFSLGSVGDIYADAGSMLADNVPLFREGSDGIGELAKELSSRTNIDASFLTGVLRDTGLNAEELGRKMAEAGTPIGTIKDVLGEMGYPAEVAQNAIEAAAGAAGKLTGTETWSTYAVMDFTKELGKVSDAGGDAAGQADALRNAIDRLNGSPIATDRLTASFETSVQAAKDLFKAGEDGVKSWEGIVDAASGQIDLTAQQGRDLQGALDALGRDATALAADAFNRVYQQTGDIDKATQAATASVDTQIQSFKDMAVAAGIPQPAIDELLAKYQLVPEQIATDVRINSVDAESGLQAMVGLLGQMDAGATANIGVVDEVAKAKLEDLGVTLTAVGDGTYTATLDADPAKAKSQVDEFTKFASSQVPQMKVSADMQPAIDQINSTVNQVISQINPFMKVSADTNPVVTRVQDIGRWILGFDTSMPVGANTNPAIAAAQEAVDQINKSRATIQIQAGIQSALNTVRNFSFGLMNANGNLINPNGSIQAFANGGFNFPKRPRQLPLTYPEVHKAHITKTLRIFGEPETGGEAYIPLSPAKRARSEKIAEEVVNRFGYDMVARDSVQYANGGIAGGPNSSVTKGNGITIIQNYPVAEKTSVANARAGQLIGAIGD